MIAFPCDKPVIKELNSYYLHIEKFLEHYQGFISAGCVYFNSPSANGLVFFDEYRFLNASYQDKTENLNGAAALKTIIQNASSKNFSVEVFEIDGDSIYFWSHISNAVILYRDLNSEFTDFAALIARMKSEKLSGYIEINSKNSDSNRNSGNQVFFENGNVIASKKHDSKYVITDELKSGEIIKNASEKGGIFHVYRIQMGHKLEEIRISQPSSSAKQPDPNQLIYRQQQMKEQSAIDTPATISRNQKNQVYYIEMLQLLLQMIDKIIKSNKKIKIDFDTLLKKIFVEKTDRYDFLDPFAAELKYENGRLVFNGSVNDQELVTGIVECAMELAERTGITGTLIKNLAPWIKKYNEELINFNIKF